MEFWTPNLVRNVRDQKLLRLRETLTSVKAWSNRDRSFVFSERNFSVRVSDIFLGSVRETRIYWYQFFFYTRVSSEFRRPLHVWFSIRTRKFRGCLEKRPTPVAERLIFSTKLLVTQSASECCTRNDGASKNSAVFFFTSS